MLGDHNKVRLRSSVFAAALVLVISTPLPAGRVPDLTPEGKPNIQSDSAFVFDMESGEVLFSKNPDVVRPIASTGKIFVALLAQEKKIALEEKTPIKKLDRRYVRGGSRTRFRVGDEIQNEDLLEAMLVASDNAAPTAVGRALGLETDKLVKELNQLSKELGFENTSFIDPVGLAENKSTAKEMARALELALRDPLLARILSSQEASIYRNGRDVLYRNTNRSLHRHPDEVLGGKTGYTRAAGYCLVIAARIKDKPLAMAFLGSTGSLTRFADFARVRHWILGGT